MGASSDTPDAADMPKIISLRLRTWWLRDELDEKLAHSADPMSDPVLGRRAAQLCSHATRADLAGTLERALHDARSMWSLSSRLPLRRSALRECPDEVLAVTRRLRDAKPIDAAGGAMVARLIFDGTSPLYRDGAVSLRYALRAARLALDPIESAIPDVWAAA